MLQAIPKSVYKTASDVIQSQINSISPKDKSIKSNDGKSLAEQYFRDVLSIFDDKNIVDVAKNLNPAMNSLNELSRSVVNSNVSQEQKNETIKELNKMKASIQGRVNMMDEYAARNPYPQNIATNTAVGIAGMLPDIAVAGLGGAGATGEALAARVGSAIEGKVPAIVQKLAPKAAALLERSVKAPFTKVMAAKGAAEGGASNAQSPLLGMVEGGLKGTGEGMYMHVLGEAAGKVSPYISKVIGKTGASSEISTAIANPLANAGVFTAGKAIRTPLEEGRMATQEELEHEMAMGIGFSLLHAGQTFKTHQEANHFYENTLKTDPQESLGRILNEKPENILRDYNPELNVKDLTEARNELKDAIIKEPDLAVKKQLGEEALKIQNQLDAKEAVEGIVKDKDALVEMVAKLPELNPKQKEEYVTKIEQIANDYDPVEVEKNTLNNKIQKSQDNIDYWEGRLKEEKVPSERMEIEKSIDNNKKFIEDDTKRLKEIIDTPKEIKPVEEVKAEEQPTTPKEKETPLEKTKTPLNETKEQPIPKVENVEEVSAPKTEKASPTAGEESVKKGELKDKTYTTNDGEKLDIKIFDGINGEVESVSDIKNKDRLSFSLFNDKGQSVAGVSFWKDKDGKWVSNMTNVSEGYRRKGIATAMYQFAKENGYDIKSSDFRSEIGNKFTNKFFKENKPFDLEERQAELRAKENVSDNKQPTVKGETKANAEVIQPTKDDGRRNESKAERVGTADQEDTGVSGIKKKLVSDEIIEGVNIDKISDKEMQDLGKKLIDTGEIKPKEIVDEIAGMRRKVTIKGRDWVDERTDSNPRALQPKEVVALIHYKATLDNERRELLTESNKLASEGKSTKAVDAKLARLQDDINSYDVMSVITAQQQSLAFRLRKGLLDKDYNLVEQIEQYKKTNGGEIPADVEAKFKALNKELTDLKEKIAVAEKKAQEASDSQAIDNIKQDVERSDKTRKSSLSTTEQARKKELAKKYRVFNDVSRIVTLIAEKDFREYAKLVLKEAKGDFQTFAVEILGTLGVDAKKYLPKLYEEIGGKGKVDMENLIDKPFVKDGELVIPNNYIRDLVNQGITDINELSEAVKKIVETDLPDVTLREVRDAITKYGKTVNQTADEVTRSINEAKRLGRLYSELEDLANQKKKAKTIKQTNKISQQERELKRQARILEDRLPKTNEEIVLAEEKRITNAISATERAILDTQERIENGELEREVNNVPETPELKEARERLKVEQDKLAELQKEAGVFERRRVENRKKQLDKFIAERRQRLADRNFAPKAKAEPIQADAELLKLEEEANRIRNEYEEAHYENEQRNRPLSQKIYDNAIGWGTGIQRALQAGLDASAFLVQGVIAIGSQNPVKTWEAVKESAKFLASEKYEQEFFTKLKSAKDFNEMKESGLALNYPNSKLGSRDYQLQGSEISKIWNFIVSPLKYTIGEKAYERAKLFNPYRATERSFTGAIDTLRVQMFREFTTLLKQDGITFESNPEMYKTAANAVNNMTFRGRLRTLEPIAKELSVLFFAPRKISATLALTNPYYWGDLAVNNPTVAKRALLKMASFIALATTLTLAHKAFNDDEEDENKDIFNPISPDFMKLKIGNTRLDFFGGLNQNVVLFARMWTNKYKTSTSSKVSTLGDNAFVPTRAELASRFLTNKFAPTSALLYRWADQGKGRQVEWGDEALNGVTPIWAQNIKELYKEHPATMASFLTGMAFFGQNMSTYGGAKFMERGKDDKLIDLVSEKGGSFSEKTRSSIEVVDEKTTEKRGVTTAEFEKYEKEYGDYVKAELKSNYTKLKAMNTEDFEKELKKIKSNATEVAKEAVSGIDEDMLKMRKDGETVKLTPEQLQERISLNKEFMKKAITKKDRYIRYFMRKDKVSKEVAEKKADKKLKSLANEFSKSKMEKEVFSNK